MKKYFLFPFIICVLIFTVFIISSCQKKSDPPVFSVLASTIVIDSLHTGEQFYAKCYNIDINMSKAIITDPIDSQKVTFFFNGSMFIKDQKFGLQDDGKAYIKKTGIWKIELSGTRKVDGVSFDIIIPVEVN